MEPQVIYEDENFLAVLKPAGLLVHAVASGKRQMANSERTLVDWLLKRYPGIRKVGDPSASSGQANLRPGIVHRLDRDTSGIILAAKNQGGFDYLKSLFKSREIRKTYLAVVFGVPKEKSGRITDAIGIKSGSVKRSVRSEKDLKAAETGYKLLQAFEREGGKFSLLEVKPRTGRTHQIRVHLAAIGNPVVGDSLYGRKVQPQWAKRLMLHALALEFNLPDGKRVRLEAEPPEVFQI